ncbi:hypothetical protein HHI36_003654 [Cryptolaemus montrouzieri]|uniref:Uncharacterized protein n=1 Tax=Cryptolaemus montrouzieri TaxID=559131 RepID=A0ABD2PFH2_9CUCU
MLISYLMCMTTQLFIFSWFGQILTIQSQELIRSSYMGNWYKSTPKVRKILFIFLERCKRPVELSAAKFFSLSLASFITILKSSYSYFAVLRSVYMKKMD